MTVRLKCWAYERREAAPLIFVETLNASDTSTHGRFSVLKKHAYECLPPLDMSQHPPWQELLATDLHGTE